MTIFEAVKTTVAPRMAAEHFGLSVSRNGMVCCPFHDDRHPSMKLYEDHYHCFGCQANGDVIAFTSKLFGITPLEAAQKLAADFGIREDRPSVLAKLKMYTTQVENKMLCFRVLGEYLHILQDWKKRYAPQTPEEEPDDRFVEACHMLECTQYPFNKKSKAEELETLLDKYVPGVEAMRTRLKKYDKTYKELTEENAELEKKLSSASKESVRKKLEISQKLNELDELRRTVDTIPEEVIRAYTAQKYVHSGRMNQEI